MNIDRTKVLADLESFSLQGHGVITGPPGVGKSYLLEESALQLKTKGIPALLIPIDMLGEGTSTDLKALFDFNGNDFFDFLKTANDKKGVKGVLLFDSFDSARNEIVRERFLGLIRRAIKELGSWNVIVSVRTYDAKRSQELLDLFPIQNEALFEDEIKCRHFSIEPLSSSEVDDAFSQPQLKRLYESANSEFKQLLKIPFNIWLLEKIFAGAEGIDFSAVYSQAQLLEIFWSKKIEYGSAEEKKILLSKLVNEMVETLSLAIPKENIYIPAYKKGWDELCSEEIIVYATKTGARIAFRHNILFDFAVSKLQIEDDAKHLAEFLAKDLSRPIFLRPSLVYYFVRLWYAKRAFSFWKILEDVLDSKTAYMELFVRILPASVIVSEAREISDLKPLFDLIERKRDLGNELVKWILQALRFLEIKNDNLWSEVLEILSVNPDREFAWDLALLATEIFDRKSKEKDEVILGKISRGVRNLLRWVWVQRKAGLFNVDGLGANLVLPLVAKTYHTSPQESRELLEKVLELTKEKGFPIQYLYRLTNEIEEIWVSDSDFVRKVFSTVFSTSENSNEQTDMGGIVLHLLSTRRQDFEMCHYSLVKSFPELIKTKPLDAIILGLESLNYFVVLQHMIKDGRGNDIESQVKKFSFRGKEVALLPDGSYIWDDRNYEDEPIKIADVLIKHIAENCKSDEFPKYIDAFRDHAIVALLWKRLIQAAVQAPQFFLPVLFELCVTPSILTTREVLYEISSFIESSIQLFTKQQREQFEKVVWNLAFLENEEFSRAYLEGLRNRYVSLVPVEFLTLKETVELKRELLLSGKEVKNEKLVKFSTWTEGSGDDDDFLRHRGVDLNKPENKEVRDLEKVIKEFNSNQRNDKRPTVEEIETINPVMDKLFSVLKVNKADDRVSTGALTTLAEAAAVSLFTLVDPEQKSFLLCKNILLYCADHHAPKPDPKYDKEYNTPSWSPLPRTEAAEGLPWIVVRGKDAEVFLKIEHLSKDPVPSVRYLLAKELWRTSLFENENFWKLVKDIAGREKNKVVLMGLCFTLSKLISKNTGPAEEILDTLLQRMHPEAEDEAAEYSESVMRLVMWLYNVNNSKWAAQFISSICTSPLTNSKSLRYAAASVVQNIIPKLISEEKNAEIVERAIKTLELFIDVCVSGLNELYKKPFEEWTQKEKEISRDLYSVIDNVVSRFFFSMDIKDELRRDEEGPLTLEQRSKFFKKIQPILLRILDKASQSNVGLMGAPTVHHFMELLSGVLEYDPDQVLKMAAMLISSSKGSRYNFDSLAIGRVVTFVEKILSDYRYKVVKGEGLKNLLILLDAFVDAGWPEALRLVWRLDQIFR